MGFSKPLYIFHLFLLVKILKLVRLTNIESVRYISNISNQYAIRCLMQFHFIYIISTTLGKPNKQKQKTSTKLENADINEPRMKSRKIKREIRRGILECNKTYRTFSYA